MGIKKKEALMKFNQDNILLAARHLFESKGIASTTMDDIAKQADYSKSTLYVYFKSKDEIYKYYFVRSNGMFKEFITRMSRWLS